MVARYASVQVVGRGRAESIRLLFKLAGVEFEDNRFEVEEWPAIKPTSPTFSVPMLEIDGKRFVQSKAILGYLARKYGFFGANDFEGACIDMVIDTADDIIPAWDLIYFAATEEEKATHSNDFREVEIPLIYSRLTRLLEMDHMCAGDYFVANKLSAADVHFFCMAEVVETAFPNSMAEFPKLQAIFDRVADNPLVTEWRKSRPVTSW